MCGLLASAGCSKQVDGPEPALSNKSVLPVSPAIICGDQLTTELTLSGERLSPVPVNIPKQPAIALPSLTLTRRTALDGNAVDTVKVLYGGDPTTPSNTSALAWDDQQTMRFTIDQDLEIDGSRSRVPAGIYDAMVVNPNGKSALAKAALAVLDKPTITSTSPSLLCLSQAARELTLSGTDYLRIAQSQPTLRVSSNDSPLDVSELEDCTDIAQEASDAQVCNTAKLTLGKDSIPPGLHEITLTNPETAACHSEESLNVRVVAAPTISEIEPAGACMLDAQQRLIVKGSGFLQVDDDKPIVMLGGERVAVAALDDCEDLDTPDITLKSCAQLALDVELSMYPVGDVAVSVTNPDPAGCEATANGAFHIAGPPMISSINPNAVCSDVMTPFTVMGSGFDRGATATIDDATASVAFVSSGELQVTALGLSAGMHSFTVINAGSCSATQTGVLTVEPSPIVFFVDPPTMYGEIPVEVTVFTSGLSAAPTKVELVRDGGNNRESLTFTSSNTPNKILARVPAGLAAGNWDVEVTNVGGCPGTLSAGLTVTDTLTDSLVSAIKPSYASTTEDTAVTISGAGFAAVPRVYLSTSGATGSARALRAVTLTSRNTLTAVIPSGLAVGSYDLIVVNPDGKADVLGGGVTVTADQPPIITTVAPASLPANASNVSLTIAGTGFKNGLAVELDCMTTNDTRTTLATTEQAPSGTGTSVVVNVSMSNATPTAPDAGSICLIRLTNADGAFFEYSALSVTNSSLNLSPWKSAPALSTARRALSLVAGRPTAASRFLYAIGGDNGKTGEPGARGSSVFDSLESSQVDVFGAMSDWLPQRHHLPSPRTAAGAATIGRFVYLLGGHDGSTATNTLLRAAILDPLAGPEISHVDAALSDGTKGLGKGLYYYQVSALRTSDDLENPGGETLGGELLPVQVPDRAEKIALTVTWNAAAGAHGYRIYRSPQPNTAADRMELLGEITCGSDTTSCDCGVDPTRCRWLDEGGSTFEDESPLPAGSLGVWHAVNGARCSSGDCLLGSAREGLAVTAIQDPTDATQFYVYAFGGRDQSGVFLDSYEVATVTVAASGSQTVADFVPGSDTLEVPRADFGVWVMSKTNANVIGSSGSPNDVWVYAGGGRTTGNTTSKTLEAGKLGANGLLAAFTSTDPLKGALVGFSSGAANDQLYTFGGVAGTADGTSAKLCDGKGGCMLPALAPNAFNSLGAAATTQRMFAGATQESAFFFVAGGHDGSNTLKSAQRTVQ